MGNCCPCVGSESGTRSSVAPGNFVLSSKKIEESGRVSLSSLFMPILFLMFMCFIFFPQKLAVRPDWKGRRILALSWLALNLTWMKEACLRTENLNQLKCGDHFTRSFRPWPEEAEAIQVLNEKLTTRFLNEIENDPFLVQVMPNGPITTQSVAAWATAWGTVPVSVKYPRWSCWCFMRTTVNLKKTLYQPMAYFSSVLIWNSLLMTSASYSSHGSAKQLRWAGWASKNSQR